MKEKEYNNEKENENGDNKIDRKKKILKDSIKTLISSEIYGLGLNSLFILNNLGVYLISYLRSLEGEKKTLTLSHNYFFALVVMITMSISVLFSPAVQNKIGIRYSIFLGGTLNILSTIVLVISKKFYIDLISYFFNCLGFFCASLIGRNVMSYFYDIRGKLLGALSISSFLEKSGYNYLAEKFLINPLSDEADVDGSYYTYNVSRNIFKFMIFCVILMFICDILCLILIVPFDKKKHENGLFNKLTNLEESKEDINSADIVNVLGENNEGLLENKEKEDDSDNEENKEKKDEKLDKKKSFAKRFIQKALKNRRFIFLFLSNFFATPLSIFLNGIWRNIAIRNRIPTSYQQNIETYRPFVECISTFIFGFISDYIPYRFIFSILSFISTFVGIIFCFTLQSPNLFTIILLVEAMAGNGRISTSSPHFIKVFGLKHYIELGGIINLSSFLAFPICIVFLFFFDQKYATVNEGDIETNITGIFNSSNAPYFILFIISGLLNCISAILSCFETEELFDF